MHYIWVFMHLKFLLISLLFFNTFIISCSKNKISSEKKSDEITSPKELYEIAIKELKEDKLGDARIKFENIEKKFPLSNRAIQSKINLAFIDYLNLNYNESIYGFNAIIELYPSYKDLDYVYYMRALCYYEQINEEVLEGKNNLNALNYFNQLLNRFPESEYSKDSRQKLILIKENIAAKHMNIAIFYLKDKKPLAAINRYLIVINNYDKTKFTPEALYRLIEIYYSLGMIEEAKRTSSVLMYNYPNSEWSISGNNVLIPKKDKTKKILLNYVTKILNINNDKD
jgi:outer membrane protein assembly factor BamD